MGNILDKAQQEYARSFRQEILSKLEGLPPDTPDWKEALKKTLDGLLQADEQPPAKKDTWDFSREKELSVFAQDDNIALCPITSHDEEFYRSIRMQYSLIYRSAYYTAEEHKTDLFLSEALAPEVFYCIIRSQKENIPIGYLGLKDTSNELWELAIELDGEYTRQGFGPRSIRLYLNELWRITGKAEFKARVEVDNIPSQKCFEQLGAKLVGLCDSVALKTDEEKQHFEEGHLDLIDAHLTELANRLGVEPRKLLSHVLEYRLRCPL